MKQSTTNTRDKIIEAALKLMTRYDPGVISVRQISLAVGIKPSVLYHYFPDKMELLRQSFLLAQQSMRNALQLLPVVQGTADMLRQRLLFHLDNAHYIVPMLRYFMAYKEELAGEPGSYIPPQAYMHIKQAIDKGIENGDYQSPDSTTDAQVIVHALNGFVLENYPLTKQSKSEILSTIQPFIERALGAVKEESRQAVARKLS